MHVYTCRTTKLCMRLCAGVCVCGPVGGDACELGREGDPHVARPLQIMLAWCF